MKREEIIEEIRSEVEKRAGRAFVHRTRKNNGAEAVGISVPIDRCGISPVVYIDEFVDGIARGVTGVAEAADTVANRIREGVTGRPEFDRLEVSTRDYILANVIPFLVNGRENERMKEDAPHRDFLDLTVFYRVVVEENADTGADDGDGIDDVPMHVMTNRAVRYGSSVMLHKGYFRELADRIGSDLYILPSSIHEVIAVPVTTADSDELRNMVADVNRSEVLPEEVLGCNVYLYSREDDELTVA